MEITAYPHLKNLLDLYDRNGLSNNIEALSYYITESIISFIKCGYYSVRKENRDSIEFVFSIDLSECRTMTAWLPIMTSIHLATDYYTDILYRNNKRKTKKMPSVYHTDPVNDTRTKMDTGDMYIYFSNQCKMSIFMPLTCRASAGFEIYMAGKKFTNYVQIYDYIYEFLTDLYKKMVTEPFLDNKKYINTVDSLKALQGKYRSKKNKPDTAVLAGMILKYCTLDSIFDICDKTFFDVYRNNTVTTSSWSSVQHLDCKTIFDEIIHDSYTAREIVATNLNIMQHADFSEIIKTLHCLPFFRQYDKRDLYKNVSVYYIIEEAIKYLLYRLKGIEYIVLDHGDSWKPFTNHFREYIPDYNNTGRKMLQDQERFNKVIAYEDFTGIC